MGKKASRRRTSEGTAIYVKGYGKGGKVKGGPLTTAATPRLGVKMEI